MIIIIIIIIIIWIIFMIIIIIIISTIVIIIFAIIILSFITLKSEQKLEVNDSIKLKICPRQNKLYNNRDLKYLGVIKRTLLFN